MEDGGAATANNVARAIGAALDWTSSPDARKAAVSYLESVKAGDVRALASTCFILVKNNWSSEIRLQALKMLQHLVRLRWEELSSEERRNFANLAVELMSEVANQNEQWPLKSQTAALVAEIVRREGLILWKELLPALISLSNIGPTQAELVSMMLRWLPEDITVHNEDLEGDRRRLLLRGLTESLPEILPLLYTLLERHFGAAVSEAGKNQLEIAKQHAATVIAALNSVNAYAEWAPLPDLAKYGVIHGCGFLLSSPDFRLHACEFFKLVSSRRRPVDETASDFDSAVSSIVQILMSISRDFLYKSASNPGAIDDAEIEFSECICESMVSLGSWNLQSISSDENILSPYLQQMLGYFQHFKLALHFQSLIFWLALMRELLSKPKHNTQTSDGLVNNSSSSSGQTDKKTQILNFLNDEICIAILDISWQRMLRKEKVPHDTAFSFGSIELWNDDFEGKGEFSHFRSKLLELVRFISYHKPLVAASKISERVVMIINQLSSSPMPDKELAILESTQLVLENVVGTVFDGSDEYGGGSSEVQIALCRIFEALLEKLLTIRWSEPMLVEVLVHYLEALGPFLKFFPDVVGKVINKLFELLSSLPCIIKDPSTNSARHARLQVCTSFIRIAKSADKSLLPHMKGIADTMGYLQDEGRLLRGEHNLLGESFLIMASAAGVQQQQEVLRWLLEPMSKPWMELDWQTAYLSDPAGLVRLCSDTRLMWSIFHTVTFFERALKRSGIRKSDSQQNMTGSPSLQHPMAAHLSWMLPPLLKLLRSIHSLWSPPVTQTLPGEVKGAMIISDVERASLLGEVTQKVHKGALSFADGSLADNDVNKEGYSEPNESDIRNWLRGLRDSGYNVLGLSTTIGNPFFQNLDSFAVILALMENVESMEFRHMRLLIHLVLIPLVKSCPSDFWERWLENLLHPLLNRAQQVLSCSWSSLLNEGRAKVPDLHAIPPGSDLKVEVMEEKLLRDLTREVCALLSAIAFPGQNTGVPVLEQSGHVIHLDASSLKDLDAFSSSSLVGFLLKHKSLAVPALQIALEAFKWTDSESMTKVTSFCGTVVTLCIATNNMELQEFVCRDLFYATIQGLALESNATISAELVNLFREIFIHLVDRSPAPRQILLSLPCIAPQDLLAFEETLTKTLSPKEQKQHMKSLLLSATGNQLKALAAQKSVNVITNVSMRPRSSSVAATEARQTEEQGEPIGLAAIM
ncbi:hypothetical protein V2J09_001093 [Rumex salicifolius]